ncbi:MAG TPA: AAA family ATPase [Pirellulales bacterium]|nr:AAA family ATPase [Pirellulales bacterium]
MNPTRDPWDARDLNDAFAAGLRKGAKMTDDDYFDEPPPGFEPDPEPNDFKFAPWDFGAADIDPTTLPPRGWLLGNWFCRGFVSSVIAGGAAGKTAFRIACALALAAKRGDVVGENVFDRVPVLFLCFEDGEDELKRRICAAMLEHKIGNRDIAGYLFVQAIPPEIKLAFAEDFKVKRGALYDRLDKFVADNAIGLVILDPLVKTHSVNENSNTEMDFVATLLSQLAQQHNVAVDTPHHVPKGGIEPGNAEAGRGASATKDAGRLGYTLVTMSTDEANQFAIEPGKRRALFRIDSAKVNILPPAEHAKWFELVGVRLENTWNPLYPNGDTVQTVKLWSLPTATHDTIQKPVLAQIFDRLRQPPAPGEMWRPDSRAGPLWAGWPIANLANLAKGQARRFLADWIKNGVFTQTVYRSPRAHDVKDGLILNELKTAEILQGFYQPKEQDR